MAEEKGGEGRHASGKVAEERGRDDPTALRSAGGRAKEFSGMDKGG